MRSLTALLLLLALRSLPVSGQNSARTPNYLYKNEHNYGITLHTRGAGLSFQFSKYRNVNKYWLMDFGAYSLKHPKEVKRPNADVPESRPYVFGKINSVYVVYANLGNRRILADRVFQKGVRLNLNYSFGPTFAILKPVYYDIQVTNPDNPGKDLVQAPFDPRNPDQIQRIMGPSSFFTGINKTTAMIGGNAKVSLNFEWGPYNYKFWSLEPGLLVNAFPDDLPIFAYPVNQKAFVNLFCTLSYGARR